MRAFEVEARADLKPARAASSPRLDPGQPGGPDGMKVDRAGRVYVAVALGVWVFEPDGRLLGILPVPARPSNLAWCDAEPDGWRSRPSTPFTQVELHVEGICPRSFPDFFRCKRCSSLNESIILGRPCKRQISPGSIRPSSTRPAVVRLEPAGCEVPREIDRN